VESGHGEFPVRRGAEGNGSNVGGVKRYHSGRR
jgi:hypothetical protein